MDVTLLAVIATGLGAWFWRHARLARASAFDRSQLDTDADVALHVALHNAKSRGQLPSSLDLLYGLLQDETIARAVALAGGDASALEDRVLGALAATSSDELRPATSEEANQVLWIASMVARHGKRAVTCRDLWAYLYGTEAAALLDAERPSRVAVLFAAIHGAPRVLGDDTQGDVAIVIWNDDYSTQELVTELLRGVFELPDAQATALMLQTHEQGKATIARLPAAIARGKLAAATARARAAGAPLYVSFEPI